MTLNEKLRSKYDPDRFSPLDMYILRLSDVPPWIANAFDDRFTVWGIINYELETGHTVRSAELNEYSRRRFNNGHIRKLFDAGISAKTANAYAERFSLKEIMKLYEKRHYPGEVNGFSEVFDCDDICLLLESGVDGATAETYINISDPAIDELNDPDLASRVREASENIRKFDAKSIALFHSRRIPPHIARDYRPEFSPEDVHQLILHNIRTQEANRVAGRFSVKDIRRFAAKNILKTAYGFDERFSAATIELLLDIGCHWHVNDYDPIFDEAEVYVLHKLGVKPDNIRDKLIPSLKKVMDYVLGRYNYHPDCDKELFWQEFTRKDMPNVLEDLTLIGSGSNSVVLLDNPKVRLSDIYPLALKFTDNPEEEYILLTMLSDPEHVIRLKEDSKRFKHDLLGIQLEYIEGETLETRIQKNGKFMIKDVFKYGLDITRGILELRGAYQGRIPIYHRDLHDRNILIENRFDFSEGEWEEFNRQKIDRAVIIDLGAATVDPYDVYAQNKAYGGNNDLISLGQLLYKMSTGHNLFNEGPGFTCNTAVKKDIKTIRETVYDDPELFQSYLNKVREDVKDRNLADLIVYLLDDDLWTQPGLEKVQETERVFERYAE
ncbi:hypothetical protein GF345_03655 [Candidatus Woesearchaeota archaeon]|nr:hypothetical protein [Candidatus Woesearchaeota archaeon]